MASMQDCSEADIDSLMTEDKWELNIEIGLNRWWVSFSHFDDKTTLCVFVCVCVCMCVWGFVWPQSVY